MLSLYGIETQNWRVSIYGTWLSYQLMLMHKTFGKGSMMKWIYCVSCIVHLLLKWQTGILYLFSSSLLMPISLPCTASSTVRWILPFSWYLLMRTCCISITSWALIKWRKLFWWNDCFLTFEGVHRQELSEYTFRKIFSWIMQGGPLLWLPHKLSLSFFSGF